MDQKLQEAMIENVTQIQKRRKVLHEAREKSIEAKEEYKDAESRYVITGIIGKNEQEREIIYANWPPKSGYTRLREALKFIIDENHIRGQLIEDTGNNFLNLEPGIPFEGGIDGAMKAAVEEIARLRVLLQAESAVATQVEPLLERNAHLASALIDERANYLDTLKRNPNCSAWTLDECSPEEQNKLRQGAANTLSLEEPLVYVELEEARKQIGILKEKLIEERANKKISMFCNCERCWPPGQPKSESRIAAEEKVRQEALQQLKEQISEVDWDGNN